MIVTQVHVLFDYYNYSVQFHCSLTNTEHYITGWLYCTWPPGGNLRSYIQEVEKKVKRGENIIQRFITCILRSHVLTTQVSEIGLDSALRNMGS